MKRLVVTLLFLAVIIATTALSAVATIKFNELDNWGQTPNSGIFASVSNVAETSLLYQLGTITGTVRNGSGDPMEGVTISVTADMRTTTGADGTFTVSNVPAGWYYVTVSKDGWCPKYIHDVLVADGVTTVCDVTLRRPASLRIRVVDKLDRPIHYAEIMFKINESIVSMQTDESGETTPFNQWDPDNTPLTMTASERYHASMTKEIVLKENENKEVVFKLADIVSRRRMGFLDTHATGIAVQGGYAYAAVYYGMQIIDVSDPASPSMVGHLSLQTEESPRIAIAGNYAYLTAGRYGLHIIDISNPASPVRVSNYATGPVYDVDVVGNYAYIAVGYSGLQILNISNPSRPVRVGSIGNYKSARRVTVAPGYAYVSDYAGGMQIIDISNPTAPKIISYYDRNAESSCVSDVAVRGNYAYLVNSKSIVDVIDVSNPATPTHVSGLDYHYDYNVPDYASAAFAGDYAVFGTYYNTSIADLSSPGYLGFVGDCWVPACDIAAAGNYIYALTGDGLMIFAIGGPGLWYITPDSVEIGQHTIDADISGLGFEQGATVTLSRAGCADIPAKNVVVLEACHITCSIDITNASLGLWDVTVTNPDGRSGIYTKMFSVVLPTTAPTYGMSNKSAIDPLAAIASKSYRFTMWGKFGISTDYYNFTVDDGSQSPMHVLGWWGEEVSEGDNVRVTGTLDTSQTPPVLICSPADIKKIN